ncbi:MAG: hypothetical protein CVU11_01380 [Bacteroidetes bacterium HGW-Bacteroidetes-6]|jgi:hypothetical protein|nr:MAG: hypothetical protein CVU11_01380 [Bacteroidetes bacterium HGW-Bacteroidetes-6]
MEENVIKNTEAAYFESVTKMFTGNLVLTSNRVLFVGEHARVQFDHGVIGNVIRDKMEKAMGYDKPDEYVINIPLIELQHELKRYGFSKRLVLRDKAGKTYSIQINKKAERDLWPEAIENAKKELS